jgi:glucokinase
MSYHLGLDVGGTKCAAVVGDDSGSVLDRVEWASNVGRGSSAMIDDLCRHASALCRADKPVVSVGVSIGGPLDAAKGIIYSPPNLPGWDVVPLRSILEERLRLPVRVEHDAAACAWAEHLWGAGKNATRLVYLTCGTGLGVGFVIDNDIYRGAEGQNCEIGHARYQDSGPTAFGKAGSIEAFCAASSLGRLAAWYYPQRWSAVPSSAEVAEMGASGDADAQQVIAANARAVGDLCALLGDLLRPDRIVLGSLAKYLGESWIQSVRERFEMESLPDTARICRIVPAGLGDRLQDCSALAVAIGANALSRDEMTS